MKSMTAICTFFVWVHTAPQLPDCQWCVADEAPDNASWKYQISPLGEPGEKLTLSGTVYYSDGITPASGIIIYAYHTNNEGIYNKRGDETGNGKRHGHLRGWIKTNEKGQYQFDTIKPAPYANQTEPAHVHLTILQPDKSEYWIESTLFEGDTLIPESKKVKSEHLGEFKFIIPLQKVGTTWLATRDIRIMADQ